MIDLDLSQMGLSALNQQLQGISHGDNARAFRVINPMGSHSIAVGLQEPLDVTVQGHTGFYCGGMNKEAHITIEGHAGPGVGENMMSGAVVVRGNAGQSAGASAHGGLLVIHGDASARCGISMKGVDIVVGGFIGHMSAFMAQKGRLVVLGDTGDALGDSLYEARIYCMGTPKSLGADCVEKKMKDRHKEELAGLLERAGFTGVDVSSFKRYGSARKLYNFQIDHAELPE